MTYELNEDDSFNYVAERLSSARPPFAMVVATETLPLLLSAKPTTPARTEYWQALIRAVTEGRAQVRYCVARGTTVNRIARLYALTTEERERQCAQ